MIVLLLVVSPLAVHGAEDSSKTSIIEVPASEILAKMQKGEPVEYDHVKVKGDLDLSRLVFQTNITSPIRINDSVFGGLISFNHAFSEKKLTYRSLITLKMPASVDQISEDAPTSVDQISEDTPTSVDQISEDMPTSVDQISEDMPTSVDQISEDMPTSVDQISEDTPISVDKISEDMPTSVDQISEDMPISEIKIQECLHQ